MHDVLVLKFGGAAVATPECFDSVANLILHRLSQHPRLVVVVSAMKGATDELIQLAKRVHPHPPERELDMLLSVGERVSISLLAMALAKKGRQAVSLTGSQSGIVTSSDHTNALILDVRPHRLLSYLSEGRIVIVAGFQGVSEAKEITTLGRGGSDTTAVALGVALKSSHIEFFKDVGGIYSQDPHCYADAAIVPRLSYDEALAIIKQSDHAVLHPRCVALAAANQLPLRILGYSSDSSTSGTWIGKEGAVVPLQPIYECLQAAT